MANEVKTWSNVAVAMQTALATAITVGAGGVTKASPGVVTYTGTDPSNGDYVLCTSSVGMTQLNNRVFRVANVNGGANTFELEDEDTSLYDTMVSANFQVITFGASFSSMLDISVSGGEAAAIPSTTIHDDVDQEEVGNFSPLIISSNLRWNPSDAAQIECRKASNVKASRAFKFTFADLSKWLPYGGVAFVHAPTGGAQAVVQTPLSIRVKGRTTVYPD